MSAHVQPNELSAKSLFTAVLYSDVPESSALSSTAERSIYLKQIRREHLARASMEEVGSQLADATGTESNTKVAQLIEKAKRAYSEANGNSADGRWRFLSDLLRLHCTRGGRHWIGTNTDIEAPVVPEHLCILPKRSHEWKQLERKRKEEEDVNSRVQRWITTAEFDPLTPETTIVPESTVNEPIPFTQASFSVSQRPIQTKQMTLKSAYDQANSTNKFGFPVVRRSHVVRKGGFRRSPSPRLPSQHFHAGGNKPRLETSQQLHPSPAHSIGRSSAPNTERVSNSTDFQPLHVHHESEAPAGLDVPASSFLLPSFPTSQIQTSTPRREPALEGQNQHTTSFEQPLPSPSADAVEIPRPTIDDSHFPEPFHLPDGHSRKRVRSPSPGEQESVLKRARISQEADRFSSPLERRPDVEEMPLKPPNRHLPRLTDLIASAKCQKLSPRKQSSSSKTPPPPVENVTEITAVPEPSIHHQDDPRRMETTKEPTPSIDAVHWPSIQDSGFEPEPSPPMAEGNAANVRVEAETTSALEIEALCPEQIPEHLLKDRRMNTDSEKLLPFQGQLAPQPDTRLTEEGPLAVPESRPQTPDPSKSPISDPFRFPSVEPDSSQASLEAASYNLYGLDNLDNPSPAKSLSSLAGSDSGSGSDEEDGGDTTAENIVVPQNFGFAGHEFNPPFASTQKPGLNSVKNAIGSILSSDLLGDKLPSTSQLQAEINSQVDEFDKFMEADLGCDPVAL